MEYILTTEKLVKNYGKTEVLKEVSIKIPKGAIYGLVGRNGAGKTTLMRVITGLHEPTMGVYTIGNTRSCDKGILNARRKIGALVETPAIYKDLSAYDNIKIQMINLGMPSFDSIPEILKTVGLENTGKKHAGKFSLGMRQRLGIAIALCGEPDILVLDEPINGLDPQGIIEVREMLLNINREHGTTILISSHILDELSRLATHYGFIDSGRILLETTSEDLTSRLRKSCRIKIDNEDAMVAALDGIGAKYKIISANEIDVYDDITASRIFECAKSKGVEILTISENDETLESFFMNLVT